MFLSSPDRGQSVEDLSLPKEDLHKGQSLPGDQS